MEIVLPQSTGVEKPLRIPVVGTAVHLDGRQSKVIISNLHFPQPTRLGLPNSYLPPSQSVLSGPTAQTQRPDILYSTASIFVSGYTSGRHVVIFTGRSDQEHEFAMTFKGHGTSPLHNNPSESGVKLTQGATIASVTSPLDGYTIVTILPGSSGLVTIWESPEQVVLFADTDATETLWAPILEKVTPGRQDEGFDSFWSIGTNETIVIGGPALVRSASYAKNDGRLDIIGDLDLDRDTFLTIVALPTDVRAITWNGQQVQTFTEPATFRVDARSVVTFPLRFLSTSPANNFAAPELNKWEFVDSLPEVQSDFDDSDWITANNETTHIPYKPHFGKNVLYGCDYGL